MAKFQNRPDKFPDLRQHPDFALQFDCVGTGLSHKSNGGMKALLGRCRVRAERQIGDHPRTLRGTTDRTNQWDQVINGNR